MSTVDKKIALVTGGSGSIGFAICQSLVEKNFQVILHYNSSKDKAEALAKQIGITDTIQSDLSKLEGIDKIYDYIKAECTGNIDVIINNAGIALDAPFFSAKIEDYDKLMQVNLRSTWYLTKRLSRFMIRKKAGRIINISSVIANVANPTQSVYAMSKAAINAFTRTIAVELSPYNILVNSIAPGLIESKMTKDGISTEVQEELLAKIPLGRVGQPSEVAEWVTFLATSAPYCTGSVLHVNGGLFTNS